MKYKKSMFYTAFISVIGIIGYWSVQLFMVEANSPIHRIENSTISASQWNVHHPSRSQNPLLADSSNILAFRIFPIEGFYRVPSSSNTFEKYLLQLPLKPNGSEVMLYNGEGKKNHNVYEAVVDLPIGKKNLHQCADAVIRLRAEYLFQQKKYEEIHFNFTNGFRANYTEWIKGKRIVVNGNTVKWAQSAQPSNTYQDLWNYLEVVFTYAGTLSLSKELKSINLEELKAGDVFIQGASPGHAVIVVDAARNTKTNQKIFLLAQSYMPAQEIQILKNPTDKSISPWYSTDFGEVLITPEWTFKKTDLKRFEE